MLMNLNTPSDNNAHDGYESTDVKGRWVIGVGIASVIILTLIIIFLNEYFIVLKEEQITAVVLKPESISLRELRAREDEILASYKKIDDSGKYQIPIERAMQILADEAFNKTQNNIAR